jgi:hypothetical protein
MGARGKAASKKAADSSVLQSLYQQRNWVALGLLEIAAMHRFKNFFMSMMGNVSFAREEFRKGGCGDRYLDDLETMLGQASDYASWLQSLSEKQSSSLIPIKLNQVIPDALEVFRSQFPSRLQWSFLEENEVPLVRGDPNLLRLMLWEFLSEYSSALARAEPGDELPGIPVKLEISTGLHLNDASSFAPGEKQAEINLKLTGFRIEPSSSRQSGPTGTLPCRSSIEIAKSAMRLFGGEIIRHENQNAHTETISLRFPICL